MKLTKANIAALKLPPGKTDFTFWDSELPGFGLRVRQGKDGPSRSWRIQYRVGVQQRSKALDCRKVSPEDARKVARQLFAQAHLGIDVAADKDKAKADAVRAKLILAAVSDRFLAVKADEMKSGRYTEKSYVAAERHFKKLNDRLTAEGASLPHWTLHDLRRTMRTGLGRLGVRPDICEMCINHTRATIVATYDRYRYQPEIAAALAQWSEHVMAVVKGGKSKVVSLLRA
jgi:hypothetical protein